MNCYAVMCSLWRSRSSWTPALNLPQPQEKLGQHQEEGNGVVHHVQWNHSQYCYTCCTINKKTEQGGTVQHCSLVNLWGGLKLYLRLGPRSSHVNILNSKSVAKMSVSKMSVAKMSISKMSAAVANTSIAKSSVAKTSVDNTPVAKMSVSSEY